MHCEEFQSDLIGFLAKLAEYKKKSIVVDENSSHLLANIVSEIHGFDKKIPPPPPLPLRDFIKKSG